MLPNMDNPCAIRRSLRRYIHERYECVCTTSVPHITRFASKGLPIRHTLGITRRVFPIQLPVLYYPWFNRGTRSFGCDTMLFIVFTGLKHPWNFFWNLFYVRDAGKWQESKRRSKPKEINPKSFSCDPCIQGVWKPSQAYWKKSTFTHTSNQGTPYEAWRHTIKTEYMYLC